MFETKSTIAGVMLLVGLLPLIGHSAEERSTSVTGDGPSSNREKIVDPYVNPYETIYRLSVGVSGGWEFVPSTTSATGGIPDGDEANPAYTERSSKAKRVIADPETPENFTLGLSGRLTKPGEEGGTVPWSASAKSDFFYISPKTIIMAFNGSKKTLSAKGSETTENISSNWTASPTWAASTNPTIAAYSAINEKGSITIGSGGDWNPPANIYKITAKKASDTSREAEATLIVIKIEQDHDLWWFNGEDPEGGYHITATLTAQSVSTGTFKWEVTAGAGNVNLNNGGADADTITATNDNTVVIKSTAASASAANVTKDVTIKLTYNGEVVDSYELAVFAPHSLSHIGTIDHDYSALPPPYPDYTGYWCEIEYQILDQFNRILPYDIPWNEDFNNDGAHVVSVTSSDYDGNNWPWGSESGWRVSPSEAIDNLARCNPPCSIPSAQNVGTGTVKVNHVIGGWYVGSTIIGKGVLVKNNCKWQMYQDHGRHE